MVIPVIIKDKELQFLVDTGSAINVIHTDKVKTLTPAIFIHTPKHDFASTVGGSTSQVFGEAKLEIDINDQSYSDDFSIMNCGQFSGILGRPFLNKYNAVINTRESILLLKKQEEENDANHALPGIYTLQQHSVTTDRRFTIRPMHETIAVAQTDLPDGTEVIMTPLTKSDQIDMIIAPCVATVQAGTIPFRCLNMGTTPFTFKGNTIIGTAELLPKEPIVNAIPFSKISNEHEYAHDMRCRQTQTINPLQEIIQEEYLHHPPNTDYQDEQSGQPWQSYENVRQEQHIEEEEQEYHNQDWQTYLKNVHRHCNSDNLDNNEPTQVTIQSEMQDAETKDIQHIINDKLTELQ